MAYLDDVKITGCLRPDPPTVTKSFSPDPIAVVDGTSALTLTITNPNASGQTIYGVAISDYLPWSDLQGTVSVNSGNTAVTGVGTAFTTQLKANSIVAIPSTLVSLPNTVSATNGSTTVTTSSGFTSNLAAGSIISIASVNYTVASVASDTSLTLARAYRGSTASGLTASTYKTYTVASITDDTHMTLVSSAASTLSSVKMSAGLTLSAAPITTCGSPVIGFSGYPAISLTGGNLSGTLATTNGSATVTGTGTAFQNELGAGRILLLPYQLTGTVSVTSGSNIVTGNTAGNPKAIFLTEVSMGQRITINSVDYIVSHVTSDSQLELTTSYAGATASGLSATSYREYTVSSIASNTSLTLSTTYASAVNLSGLTVKAGLAGGSATCTITASVKANAAGVRENVSGNVTSSQSGDNNTSTGYAIDDLTAVLPPVISKAFVTDSIIPGGTSTLTFTINNPSPTNALSGVKFTDIFPSGVTVYSPVTTTNSCTTGGTPGTLYSSGGTVALAAGDGSIRLGSSTDTNTATIAAGGSCTITVKVTASTTGTYTNTTGNVAHIINGSTVNGNVASDTLVVRAVTPGIKFMKQVGATSTGPWYDSMIIVAGQPVWYKFTVENTGDVPLNPVTVTDDTFSPSCSWSPTTTPLPGGGCRK